MSTHIPITNGSDNCCICRYKHKFQEYSWVMKIAHIKLHIYELYIYVADFLLKHSL